MLRSSDPLWFFWAQCHMTFLRWLTLYSATRFHNDVRLILGVKCLFDSRATWSEKQDFQEPGRGPDWSEFVDALPLTIYQLRDIAPVIADRQMTPIHTADALRWWILATRGGTFADMDILFIGSLPPIIRDIEVTKFSAYPKVDYVPVSLVRGRPCNYWGQVYQGALDKYDPDQYESCGSVNLSCQEGALTGTLDENIIYPWAGSAHPWALWHHWLFGAKHWPSLPKTCCGIHWYAGRNQQWNQRIGHPSDLPDGAIGHYVRILFPEIFSNACVRS